MPSFQAEQFRISLRFDFPQDKGSAWARAFGFACCSCADGRCAVGFCMQPPYLPDSRKASGRCDYGASSRQRQAGRHVYHRYGSIFFQHHHHRKLGCKGKGLNLLRFLPIMFEHKSERELLQFAMQQRNVDGHQLACIYGFAIDAEEVEDPGSSAASSRAR